MASKKIYDLAIKIGSYEDKDNPGKRKGRYRTLGALMEDDNGDPFIVADALAMDSLLVGLNMKETKNAGDRVMLSLFKPRDNNEKPKEADKEPQGDDDDIPF